MKSLGRQKKLLQHTHIKSLPSSLNVAKCKLSLKFDEFPEKNQM